MAEDDAPGGDRTEAASPRRLERAREAGHVPLSREISLFVSLLSTVVALNVYVFPSIAGWCRTLVATIAHAAISSTDREVIGASSFLIWLSLAWPPLLAAAAGGSIALLAQTRFLIRPQAITLHFSRVNPAAGIKRLIRLDAWVESGKSTLKLIILLVALYLICKYDFARVALLPQQALSVSLAQTTRCAWHMLYTACAVQGGFGAADLLWVRYKHARDLRMSKQELRDEAKEMEGSPHIKAKVRQIIFARARRRMMARVPTATVVITNPTHYAVALAYERASNAAPRIVAKGIDQVALKIREVAEKASVPIVSNPPLARALHQLELDTEIPSEHFQAVARIIAYIWRLRHQRASFS